MGIITRAFTAVLRSCYHLLGNYGVAVIVFTFLSKLILLPAALWTYFNSIKMIRIQPEINELKARFYGQPDIVSEEQNKLFRREGYSPFVSVIPTILQLVLLLGVVGAIRAGIEDPGIHMDFLGLDLSDIPNKRGIVLLWSPILAGLSSLYMCVVQNRSNVLQAEQSRLNRYGVLAFSVGLSLYLGWFVPLATCLYWVCSNLLAVVQLYILNAIVKPKRQIDYERLEKSRQQLAELNRGARKGMSAEDRKRERRDYKRFFSVVNKHLVFYSESSGFYKYFQGYIEYLLNNTNITIHYVTSDRNDRIFEKEKEEPRIRAYFIGENKLITLMMKMDADVVVMTMPDLENFHIKRSYVRDDIEYIYVQHDINNHAMLMRRGCTDHFDTVFLAGRHQKAEEEEFTRVYGLKPRTLVEVGYPLIDSMRAAYRAAEHREREKKRILIAPSWQKDNIIDSCLEEILDLLAEGDHEVVVRPHPQEVRLKQEFMSALKKKYENTAIEIQTDFSSNSSVWDADLLITDWSGISWEYAFTTLRPVLFINTPMKIINPDYREIKTESINIKLRDEIGMSLDLDRLDRIPDTVRTLLERSDEYRSRIDALAHEYLYHLDGSAAVGGRYIVRAIQRIIADKKEKETPKK